VVAVGIAVILLVAVIVTRAPFNTATQTTTSAATGIQNNALTTTQTTAAAASTTSGVGAVTVTVYDCQAHYPSINTTTSKLSNGTVVSSTRFPVLLLAPGSFGHICVKYSDRIPQTSFEGQVDVNILDAAGTTNATGLEVGVNTTLSLDNSSQTVSIVLTALYTAKGIYWIAPTQFCIGIPLAVGYTASQLNSANFSAFFQSRHCPLESLQTEVVGYDVPGNGMSLAILTYQTSDG